MSALKEWPPDWGDHEAELVAEFHDAAETYGTESFKQIEQRVLKGRPWPSESVAEAAREMFDLARVYPNEIDSN